MRQNWRELLFLHWAFQPEQVRPLIPAQLELDLFDGMAYVGMVAFTMRSVRPVGLPSLPKLSNFHETNVRTYVHFRGKDPGVWFFSLDAANSLAVVLARLCFHLPYHHARMFLENEIPGPPPEPQMRHYAGVRRQPGPLPASYLIRGATTGPAEPARVGTLEHFLVERYLLYCSWRDRLYQGQVFHTPYPLQTAYVSSFDENMLAASGLERPTNPPLVHFARGVDVEVFSLRRIG
jgi:uncharacterized protein YqjF (DUF2071 family)